MKQVNREKDGKLVDISQLRQPIKLGGNALDQVLNAVHYGSPEMRTLLQIECNFIFECKVCRGLFRDLPNFISHKRVFCDKSVVEEQWVNLAQVSEEEVVMVESEATDETRSQRSEESTSASACEGDLPTGAASEQVDHPTASSNQQKSSCPLSDSEQVELSAAPQPDPSDSILPGDHKGSSSGSQTVHQPCSHVEKQQHNMTSSGARPSLEDTVQRLQARNAGQFSSLQVYTNAIEKVQRQKESAKVTTIKTTPIPTNRNAIYVDITTKSKQVSEQELTDETKETLYQNMPNLSEEENSVERSEDKEKQSRRKAFPFSKEDRGEVVQRTSKSIEEKKLLKKKEDEPKMYKRDEKQKLNKKKEQKPEDEHRHLEKNEESSGNEITREEKEDNDSNEHMTAVRNRVIQGIPKELIRIGKPRKIYPEPQQLLMNQLREMQDKVKQKAEAEGKTKVMEVSDDENDSDSSSVGILLPTKNDDLTKLSPTSRKSSNLKNGVYKCRMCTYEALDKADCIRHILRKHRYAMRHKSTLAIRSMAVYQSPSKNHAKTKLNSESGNVRSGEAGVQEKEEGLHDFVRKNLQFALQKAEEILKTRQNTNQEQDNRLTRGQRKEEANHPFLCKKCNKVYSSKAVLNFHIGLVHSDTRTYFPCTLCKNVFASLQGVMRHLQSVHHKPSDKVDQMRERLKKKAFSKPNSQCQTQQPGGSRSGAAETFRKRMPEDTVKRISGPSKRQRLDSIQRDKEDFGEIRSIGSIVEAKVSRLSNTSGVASKGADTTQEETQAKQPIVNTNGAKGEKETGNMTPSNKAEINPTLRSSPEKNGPFQHKVHRTEMSTRRSLSPRRSKPQDLLPKPSSYVCRKCKHNFGRKISYDNHIEMCRGGRLNTTPVMSKRKTVHSSASSTSPVQTSTKQDCDKQPERKDQAPSKALLPIQNSVATRSKHRDSSSESQRSTSSDIQTSMKPRARFSRSLSPDRNTQNRKASPAEKSSNREKYLRRQIASFGNLNDGVRGRSRRTVFSKYAKLPSYSGRLEQIKGSKFQINRNKDACQKNESNSKEVAAIPLSSPASTRQDEDSKSTLGMSASTSKNKMNSRQTRSGLKGEHISAWDNGRSKLNEPDLSSSLCTTLMESENTKLSAAYQDDKSIFSRDGELSGLRGTDVTSSSEFIADKSQGKTVQASVEFDRKMIVEERTQKVEAFSHGQINNDFKECTERTSVATATQKNGLCDPLMDDKRSDMKPNFNEEESTNSISSDNVQSNSQNRSNKDYEERVNYEHSQPNINIGNLKMSSRISPNTKAINKLMDALKQTSVKKVTNRGRSLDDTGLKHLEVKPDLTSKVEGPSEMEETSQPSHTRESLGNSLEGEERQRSESCLLKYEFFEEASEQQISEVSSLKNSDSGANTLQLKTSYEEKDSKEDILCIVAPDLSQASKMSSSHVSGRHADSSDLPWQGTRDKSTASSQIVLIDSEEESDSKNSTLPEGRDNNDTNVMVSDNKHCSQEPSTADQALDSCVRSSPKISNDRQKAFPSSRINAPPKASSSEEETNNHFSLFRKIGPSLESENKSGLNKTESNLNSNNLSNSRFEMHTRSGKQLTEGRSQSIQQDNLKSNEDQKRDLRSRIALNGVKERQGTSGSRSFKTCAAKSRNIEPLSRRKVESPSKQKAQGLPKKSVRIVDYSTSDNGLVKENIRDLNASKTRKKRDKEASRIKSSANRAYVMRSSAGEEKLECFDKAKINRFIDKTKTKCLGCGMKYSKMYNLRRHIISNHLKWTRFRCSLCGCENYDRSHCVRHIKKAHRQALREQPYVPIKSLIINLTKQGSQVRSKKITYSIKRNQESERRQSESIYARPTLSLRRRGRPTLALLSSSSSPSSSSSFQNIPAEVVAHSRKKAVQRNKSDATTEQDACSLGIATPQLDSSRTQHVSQSCTDLPSDLGNGETSCAPGKLTNADVLIKPNRNSSEHLLASNLVLQGSKECIEKSNIFAETHGTVPSPTDALPEVDNLLIGSLSPVASQTPGVTLSKRGMARTQKMVGELGSVQSSSVSKPDKKVAKRPLPALHDNSSSAAQHSKNYTDKNVSSSHDSNMSTSLMDFDINGAVKQDTSAAITSFPQGSSKTDLVCKPIQSAVASPTRSMLCKSVHLPSGDEPSSPDSKNLANTACDQRSRSSSPEYFKIDEKLLDPPVVFIKSLPDKNLPQT